MIHLLLIIATVLCFAAAAAGVPSRVNLEALGLLLLTLLLVVVP
jgi:hypothetical protein